MASTFTSPALERKADLICVGRVTNVRETYISKTSGKYYVTPVEIDALDAGRNIKDYVLMRPEWMKVMSTSELIRLKEEDKGAHFVYGSSIATSEENKQSKLQGLSQTTEDFNELASRLINIGPDKMDEEPTLFSDTLRQFFVEERGDRLIGYVLRQQTEKTGELDENGKEIRVPTKNWEVAQYFQPTEKNLDRFAKKAEKNPTRFKLTYAGVPY